jgi:hypothetical protein
MIAVDAGLEHHQPQRQLALELVGDADDGALGDVRMAASTASMPPVESRWPATLMMSSMRLMTNR